MPIKPLKIKAYGSIPHLIGSRRGDGDHGVTVGEHDICTRQCKPGQTIIVQEKLDGSCVSIANVNGEIVPLIRAGYRAIDSNFPSLHRPFHDWAMARVDIFRPLLKTHGERICGEWLGQAHGTRYDLKHFEPFVPFDIMVMHRRVTFAGCGPIWSNLIEHNIFPPLTIWNAPFACPIEYVMKRLAVGGHGNLDPVEGAVWRVEEKGEVKFLAKYVRPDKVDGAYLESVTGKSPVWNWQPTQSRQ